MATQQQLILCTCPDEQSAQVLAHGLIEHRLAACVNIVPSIQSVYRWQDQVENTQECLLLIKAHRENYSQIEHWICQHHPYELPEIIAFAIEQGLHDYLHWINTCHN